MVFIGRENEINEILDDLESKKGTRLLLVGESGIGKSAILDELHRRLSRGGPKKGDVYRLLQQEEITHSSITVLALSLHDCTGEPSGGS